MLNTLPGFRNWAARTFNADKTPFVAAGQWDLSETLPQSLLLAQDHASMSESMELRTPFLSRELAGVTASFDPRSLIQFGRKGVFRRLRDRYLQGLDLDTRKHGFLFSSDQLVRDYGSAAPAIEELPKRFVEAIWERRFEGEGWTRLALRLAIYERWKSGVTQARPAALSAAG
jgi:asparagine synthetase B (glutamine-hydrolysing)